MKISETEYDCAIEKYLGGTEKVIETHMSKVYLGKSEAIKAFKAIDVFFVDMRPLLKRKMSAIKTAEIDKAFSPDLNTRVATVVFSNGVFSILDGVIEKPALGPHDEIIDYVIVMRRFSAPNELRELYINGEVTRNHAAQIGALLAEAHKKAKTSHEISRIGFDAITGNFDEALGITKKYIEISISREDYDAIYDACKRFMYLNVKFLKKRRDSGFIRQCHGDAHSGNMFVEDGKVKLFDPIGFKDEFCYMDVISDLAFACMDAIFFGRKDIAEGIKDAYLRKTTDHEGVDKLLDFYIAYRAFVRGEVTTMAAMNWRKGERNELLLKAKKNFGISKEYALKAAARPKLFLVIGYVASGKSTVSDELAHVFGAEIISTDDIRREIFPLEPDYLKINLDEPASMHKIIEWIKSNDIKKINFQAVLNPMTERADKDYRQIIDRYGRLIEKQKDEVYETAFERLDCFLSNDKYVVFDATFSKRTMREKAYEIARRRRVKDVYVIQVICNRDAVKERINARKKVGTEVTSEARQLEIYDLVKKEFDESGIELDKPKNIGLKRVVYHTDTYEIEKYGELDSIMEIIEKNVIDTLIGRYRGKQ